MGGSDGDAMEAGQAGEFVDAGAVGDAGGIDAGQLGESAAAVGCAGPRCAAAPGDAGKILRETRANG